MPTDRGALVEMIREKETASKARDSLTSDLDFLFGKRDDAKPVEALERKFWALMRLMAK